MLCTDEMEGCEEGVQKDGYDVAVLHREEGKECRYYRK